MTVLRLPDGVRLPALYAYRDATGLHVVVSDSPYWQTATGGVVSDEPQFNAIVASWLVAQAAGHDMGDSATTAALHGVALVPLSEALCPPRRPPAGTTT